MFPAIQSIGHWFRGNIQQPASGSLPVFIEGLENRCLLSASLHPHASRPSRTPAAVIVPMPAPSTANTTINLLAGQRFTGTVATFRGSLVGLGRYSVSIDWGDDTTSNGRLSRASRNQLRVTGSHTYAEAGQYDVTVTVATRGNSQPLAVLHVSADVAQNSANGVTIQPVAGESFSGAVAHFDSSGASPVNKSGSLRASSLQATIDWGDGTRTTIGQVQSTGSGGYDVLGTHTYAAPGSYRIRVIVYSGPAPRPTPRGILRPLFGSRIVGTASSTADVTAPPVDTQAG